MLLRYTPLLIAAMALPASANVVTSAQSIASQQAETADERSYDRFAPRPDRIDHRIDYSHWDEALSYFVIPMGPSVREGAPRVSPTTGTRRIYGHESRYRLEGNRVAFSFLNDDVRQALTAYREDLEQVGSSLDLARLPRNEQLAYWLNLHNVAMVEALAKAYPLSQPSDLNVDSTKLVTVAGVALSPREIRENIVYPNWRDPKVIYGFWRGEIGGPSIQRIAYDARNLEALLSLSGEEFVNSLRGVERFSGALQLSAIYKEAAPYYFADDSQLREHLAQFARDDVKRLIERTPETRFKTYEGDLADLARGERNPALAFVGALDDPVGGGIDAFAVQGRAVNFEQTRINRAITRLMDERKAKLKKAYKRGIRTGTVIFHGSEIPEGYEGKEVE